MDRRDRPRPAGRRRLGADRGRADATSRGSSSSAARTAARPIRRRRASTLRALGGNATSRALVLLDGVPIADPFFGYIPFNALAPERLAAIARHARRRRRARSARARSRARSSWPAPTRGDLPPCRRRARSTAAAMRMSVSRAALSPASAAGFVDAVRAVRPRRRVLHHARRPARRRRACRRAIATGRRRCARSRRSARRPNCRRAGWSIRRRPHAALRGRGQPSPKAQDASLRLVARGRWQFDALAYVQARNFTNVVISATSFRLTLDQRNTPSTGLGGKIELRPPVGGGHVLRIGADVRLADGELYEDAYSAVTGLVTARRSAGGRTSDRRAVRRGRLDDRRADADRRRARRPLDDHRRLLPRAQRGGRARPPTTASPTATGYGGDRARRRGVRCGRRRSRCARRPIPASACRRSTNCTARSSCSRSTTQANAALGTSGCAGSRRGSTSRRRRRRRSAHRVRQPAGRCDRQRHDRAQPAPARAMSMRSSRRASRSTPRGARGAVRAVGLLRLQRQQGARDGAAAALDGLRPRKARATPPARRSAGRPRRARCCRLTAALCRQAIRGRSADRRAARRDHARRASPACRSARGVVDRARAENLFDETVVTRNQGGSIDLGTPRTLWIGVRIGG